MIKPDAMKNGHAGAIIDRIIKEGFRIVAMKLLNFRQKKPENFMPFIKKDPFTESLFNL
jgi:nucleoside-diphosphate kinase